MNLFNVTFLINTITCASNFANVREAYVLENTFWEGIGKKMVNNEQYLMSVFIELMECRGVYINPISALGNNYHDEDNEKFYFLLCSTDVNLELFAENHSNEKLKLIKFEYTFSPEKPNPYSAVSQKSTKRYNYKIFKKTADNSFELKGNRVDIHLYHIKQILLHIFEENYLSLQKINSIKKKKLNAEFPDFELLHFNSPFECQKSLKRFVRFLNCLKLVGKYPDFGKKYSSSDDDFNENNESKNNKGENNENNENENDKSNKEGKNKESNKEKQINEEDKKNKGDTSHNNKENNSQSSSLSNIPSSNEGFSTGKEILMQRLLNARRNLNSDSSSSEENNVNDNNILIIDNQPWRKKVLFDIEEESSIEIESSSSEEDYTVESPNRRLKLIFLEKYLKEKIDKDYKAKKKDGQNGRFLYKQIKLLFRECCDTIAFFLIYDRKFLPVKGIYTTKFYLDKFYEFIKNSIDILIEDFDKDDFKSEFKSTHNHEKIFTEQVAAFYASIKKNVWEQFDSFEHFAKVIGNDISELEDCVEVEKVLCDYYNMMITLVRDKSEIYYYDKPILFSPLLIDKFDCCILKMIEVVFEEYTPVDKIYGYDSSKNKILLKKNEDFLQIWGDDRKILFYIEKIRDKNINEIEFTRACKDESLRLKINDHLNFSS